ncbi:MAG: hypothetical protein JST62_08235 [Bacteroidetes bacterium]|nr:hypothetical protein [Bacteroidota bacterium]
MKLTLQRQTNANPSARAKELQANAKSQPNAAHLPLPYRTTEILSTYRAIYLILYLV